MSKFILTKRDPKRIALILALTLALNCLLIYTCSFDSYAEGSDTSVSVISHSHRGSSESGGSCYGEEVHHVHEGNPEEGGGCYQTPVIHHHSDECYGSCEVRVVSVKAEDPDIMFCTNSEHYSFTNIGMLTVEVSHSSCGRENEIKTLRNVCYQCYPDSEAYAKEHLETTHDNVLICHHTDGEVTGYELSCGKDENTVERFEKNCGLEEKEYGAITFTNQDTGWSAGPVFLTGVLSDPEGVISRDGFGEISYSTDDGTIDSRSDAGISVTSNGTYKMKVSVNEEMFDSASAEVALTVSNIDSTAPQIGSVLYDTSSMWVRNNLITVSAEDIQPDNTLGSGLDDAAYSFDGGVTWQTDNTYLATSPGTVEIRVRDKCGNIASSQVVTGNVDDKGPVINVYANPEKWKQGDGPRTFTIAAWDEGCGLNVVAYSYDGGITWTGSNSLELEEEGTYTVLVRDGLGNQTSYEINNEYTQDETQGVDTTGGGSGTGTGDDTTGGSTGTGGNTTGESGEGTGSGGNITEGNGTGTGIIDDDPTGGPDENKNTDTDKEKEEDTDKEADDNKDGDKDKDPEDKETTPKDNKDNETRDGKDGKDKDEKPADDKPQKPGKPNRPTGLVVVYDNPITPVFSNEQALQNDQNGSGSTGNSDTNTSSTGSDAFNPATSADKDGSGEKNEKDTAKKSVDDDDPGNRSEKDAAGKKTKKKGSNSGWDGSQYNDHTGSADGTSGSRDANGWVEFNEGSGAYYYPLWNPGTASVDAGILYADPSVPGLTAQASDQGQSTAEDGSESEEVIMDSTWSDQAAKTLKNAKLEEVPFYRTKAFKVTASVGGSTLGALIPLGIFLFMYSGVLVYSYDSKKYRFMGIKMVHRSERGRYINMSREFMEKSFSSKYKLYMGRIYTKMHPDELLYISADKDWMSVPVQKHSYITIRNT